MRFGNCYFEKTRSAKAFVIERRVSVSFYERCSWRVVGLALEGDESEIAAKTQELRIWAGL